MEQLEHIEWPAPDFSFQLLAAGPVQEGEADGRPYSSRANRKPNGFKADLKNNIG
jgi:hypothetical protein